MASHFQALVYAYLLDAHDSSFELEQEYLDLLNAHALSKNLVGFEDLTESLLLLC